jgi:hypothetical protein
VLVKKLSGRHLKRRVLKLLQQENAEQSMNELCRLPARKVVNPLFSFLCSLNELVKWRAISAMGAVVSNLAAADPESARVIMRRFIWQLNDESGGIGWGCPEAMGDTMACSSILADEYNCILISYIRPDGNFLEHEILQRGVIWGVGRLAYRRPGLLSACGHLLIPYLLSKDATLRGLAAWAAGAVADAPIMPSLEQLATDNSRFRLYREWQITEHTVGSLARDAITAAENQSLTEEK